MRLYALSTRPDSITNSDDALYFAAVRRKIKILRGFESRLCVFWILNVRVYLGIFDSYFGSSSHIVYQRFEYVVPMV